ncbi:MAG: hypothetical protein RPU37_11905 [Candidatus Sedimenticola sp. (ex Thyasira tokunagai)]
MPITLTTFEQDNLCKGHIWEFGNEELLVDIVAQVMVGKQRHIKKILEGVTGRVIDFRANAVRDAVEKLTVQPGAGPWHRDGLIFQIFSWISANISSGPSSVIRPPHLIPAQKGFDGLQVDIDTNTGNVSAVIIFEDKATTSPRNTVREMVWPEFSEFNSGERESELEQEITTLIETRKDLIVDVDAAIETLIWNNIRKFRVAITADAGHLTEAGRTRLFRGYDVVIPNEDTDYRRAEIVHIDNLREWMDAFSQRVINVLEEKVA